MVKSLEFSDQSLTFLGFHSVILLWPYHINNLRIKELPRLRLSSGLGVLTGDNFAG